MKKRSLFALAMGVAAIGILASGQSFAGPVDDEIARVNQLLVDQPSETSVVHRSSTAEAIELRDEAEASLQAGNTQAADSEAKLALHELNEDGVPFNPDETAFTPIEGGPGGLDLPALSAAELSGGAVSATRSEELGRGVRTEPVETNSAADQRAAVTPSSSSN